MHNLGSTIWHIAFIIQFGGLLFGTVVVVALLVATVFEMVKKKVRGGQVSIPAVVQESADRSATMNA